MQTDVDDRLHLGGISPLIVSFDGPRGARILARIIVHLVAGIRSG